MCIRDRHNTLPKSTPAAVPNTKATSPRITILMVVIFKNASALVVAPTEVPSKITTIYINALDAVSVNWRTTPDSRNRLPTVSYTHLKDYYYLPEEDTAIHKSVAFYVDKNYRTKAKAATCYSKKTCCFLPHHQVVVSPYFKLEYHDKITYFELTDEFIDNETDVKAYVMHVLSLLLMAK